MAASGSDVRRWDFLRALRVPVASWTAVEKMTGAARSLASSQRARLPPLVDAWDRLLDDVDGEPLRRDWRRFRPLRLSREEDWSDWLQHLLERSDAGRFAGHLFERAPTQSGAPRVDREISIAHRRLDLRVTWTDGTSTHVEVKVGDDAFEKTFETAALNRAELEGASCDDFILLPRGDLAAWSTVAANAPREIAVRAITWHDVARSLRRALAHRDERASWRVWAAAFLGAIHQSMLGHPAIADLDRGHHAVALAEVIEMLEGEVDADR